MYVHTLNSSAAGRAVASLETEGLLSLSSGRIQVLLSRMGLVTQTEGKGPYKFRNMELVVKIRENLVVNVKHLVYFGRLWCDLQRNSMTFQ